MPTLQATQLPSGDAFPRESVFYDLFNRGHEREEAIANAYNVCQAVLEQQKKDRHHKSIKLNFEPEDFRSKSTTRKKGGGGRSKKKPDYEETPYTKLTNKIVKPLFDKQLEMLKNELKEKAKPVTVPVLPSMYAMVMKFIKGLETLASTEMNNDDSEEDEQIHIIQPKSTSSGLTTTAHNTRSVASFTGPVSKKAKIANPPVENKKVEKKPVEKKRVSKRKIDDVLDDFAETFIAEATSSLTSHAFFTGKQPDSQSPLIHDTQDSQSSGYVGPGHPDFKPPPYTYNNFFTPPNMAVVVYSPPTPTKPYDTPCPSPVFREATKSDEKAQAEGDNNDDVDEDEDEDGDNDSVEDYDDDEDYVDEHNKNKGSKSGKGTAVKGDEDEEDDEEVGKKKRKRRKKKIEIT